MANKLEGPGRAQRGHSSKAEFPAFEAEFRHPKGEFARVAARLPKRIGVDFQENEDVGVATQRLVHSLQDITFPTLNIDFDQANSSWRKVTQGLVDRCHLHLLQGLSGRRRSQT